MSGERTERPTGRRLSEAKRRGQIARSRDLNVAVSTLVMTGALGFGGLWLMGRLSDIVVHGMVRLARPPLKELTAEELTGLVFSGLLEVMVLVGPLAVIAAAAGVLVTVMQGGFNVATEAL